MEDSVFILVAYGDKRYLTGQKGRVLTNVHRVRTETGGVDTIAIQVQKDTILGTECWFAPVGPIEKLQSDFQISEQQALLIASFDVGRNIGVQQGANAAIMDFFTNLGNPESLLC